MTTNVEGWIHVQTIAVKKQHYFRNGETLCGKYFNTNIKVKGDNIKKCEACKKILADRTITVKTNQ